MNEIYSGFPTAIATAVATLTDRVFPTNAVEGYSTPYCTYELINSLKVQTLEGYAGEGEFDYQFNFYDISFDQAKANANAFWEYIKNYRGTLGGMILQDTGYLNESESSDLAASKVRYNAILELRFFCIPI